MPELDQLLQTQFLEAVFACLFDELRSDPLHFGADQLVHIETFNPVACQGLDVLWG